MGRRRPEAVPLPAICAECGGAWVFRAAWWREPALIPEWGYLAHCAQGHFAWFAADLDEPERVGAEQRFLAGGRLMAERPPGRDDRRAI